MQAKSVRLQLSRRVWCCLLFSWGLGAINLHHKSSGTASRDQQCWSRVLCSESSAEGGPEVAAPPQGPLGFILPVL